MQHDDAGAQVPGPKVQPVPVAAAEPAPSAAARGFAEEALQTEAERRLKGGLSWFTTIAALSALNTLIGKAGAGLSFPVGLGVTQVFDGIGAVVEKNGHVVIAYGLFFASLGVSLLVYLLRAPASRLARWAWILMLCGYTADALILLAFGDWLGVGFHGWGLVMLWFGYQQLGEVERQQLARAAAR